MRRVLLALALVTLLATPAVAQQLITIQAPQVAGIVATTVTRDTILLASTNYGTLDVLIRFTATGTATGAVQLFLEDSADGGVTWDDLISSNAFTFGAAVSSQHFFVTGDILTTATSGAAPAIETLAAGTTRQGPFGDRIRVREKVTGPSGSPVGPTYTITAVAK